VSLTRRELLELAIVSAVTPFAGAAAAQTPAAPGVSFTSLRRDVGIFTGRGGTIGWLVTPDAGSSWTASSPTRPGPVSMA
jgi:hypothetical protein